MMYLKSFYAIVLLQLLGILMTTVMAQSGGTLRLAPNFLPDPSVLEYIAGGNVQAKARFAEACPELSGFIDSNPDHLLILEDAFDYLDVQVESQAEVELIAVHARSGTVHCASYPPRLRMPWRAGEYRIYVSNQGRNRFADYRLLVSEYQQDFSDFGLDGANPFHIVLQRDFRPDPVTRDFVAGGARNATSLFGTGCVGYIADTPDFTLELLEPFDFLRLAVQSDADTTLVVQARASGQSGVWCNDDADALNPELGRSWRAGRYAIYVGLQTPQQAASYQLSISQYPVPADERP